MPPIRVVREIKPIGSKDFQGNIRVYDLGENFSGVCRIRLSGERGTKVTMRHGELAFADGRVNQGNINIYFQRERNNMPFYHDPNETIQTNIYYLRGGDAEEYTPSFTYHGFRYIEIESDRPVKIESLTGLFLHTDVQPVGNFECSDETLNWIVKATRQSYLSNLHSIPTDCPQREKNGWTADAYIALDLATLNYDGITLYEKWLRDFEDNQHPTGKISSIIPSWGWGYFANWVSPVWDASKFIIPATLYKYYGDRRVIERMWSVCEKYLEYVKTTEKDGMLTFGQGDWVYYKTPTNNTFTSTSFYYLDNILMTRFAEMLGKDPAPYRAKAETLRQLVNEKFFDPKTLLYAGGTQAAQSVALALGIVPAGMEQGVADKLVEMIRNNNHNLDFGMLGSKYVPAMLAKYGYVEDAYKMIVNPNPPSWAHWKELGLTALPETWVMDKDFRDASLNHVFLGDVSAWMVNTITGINYEELTDGSCRMVIQPHFLEKLQWAKAEYRSPRGMVRSSWQREGNKIRLKVTIPGNVSAKVHVGKKVVIAGAGDHEFVIAL
jgi:alpha-L-rhamnosidase